MLIEWSIKKRAGHLRPKLEYRITLEEFEIELAVPMVRITSTIPRPPDPGRHFVWPDGMDSEREKPVAVYDLCAPSHKTGFWRETMMLPIREDNHYPEVEESFIKLRRVFEKALLSAYASSAFETRGTLEMTPETKQRIAPAVAAKRFLAQRKNAS